MSTIAKLAIEISANSAKLRAGLAKATSNIKTFVNKASKVLKGISVGIAIGAASGIALIISQVNKYSAEIDRMAKTSSKPHEFLAAHDWDSRLFPAGADPVSHAPMDPRGRGVRRRIRPTISWPPHRRQPQRRRRTPTPNLQTRKKRK